MTVEDWQLYAGSELDAFASGAWDLRRYERETDEEFRHRCWEAVEGSEHEGGDAEHRRRGERWAEIAIANWLNTEALQIQEPAAGAVRGLAQRIQDRTWRRPEFQTGLDWEAEAAQGLAHAGQAKSGSDPVDDGEYYDEHGNPREVAKETAS